MSNRKLAKAIQHLFRQIWKLYRSLSKGFVTWLLRLALLPDRRRRRAASGFVLPTTVFLILVVTLTSGALTYRAFSNSARVIGNVQSKEVYNAATPALDRARTKIEFLFTDKRYPGGVPSEGRLVSMMLNDGRSIKSESADPNTDGKTGTQPNDPYTLQDEIRVDVNGDGSKDNAWIYRDPQTQANVIYSITFATPPGETVGQSEIPGTKRLLTLNEQEKANGTLLPDAGPFTRSAPIGITRSVNCPDRAGAEAASRVEEGWYIDPNTTAKVWKRFQVDAFVAKDDAIKPGKSGNFTTLEFAQDRVIDRGNKWGAWFRNDLEVYPGAVFNWNGAMHSEGSIFVGGGGNFNAYLISARPSCLFLPESNSEISVRQKDDDVAVANDNAFVGVIAAALARDNTFSGNNFPVHRYNNNNPDITTELNTGTQWVAPNSKSPIEIALNPELIVKEDRSQARGGDITNADSRIALGNIPTNPFGGRNPNVTERRFRFDNEGAPPYLDDTFRADNLYGPKKVYQKGVSSPNNQIGQPIASTDPNASALTRQVTDPKQAETSGLDGYWERRSIVEGLRLLVGERLELGNPSGWVAPKNRPTSPPTNLAATSAYPAGANGEFGDFSDNVASAAPDPNTSDQEGDPLYPPYRVNDITRAHEERERKALRDNLSAVQATAVYHHSINGGTYPVACLATTAHPGTAETLKRSVNFAANPYLGAGSPWVDFFSGNGTNGWEFAPPATSESAFSSQVTAGQPLGNALRNLANFAGDPDGAYPPEQGNRVRPDPTLTMWGNFSNLRRAIANLNAGGYNSLSPADKTYLQTASCTLGLLAHNINQVQNFDLAAVPQSDMFSLGDALFELIDGTAANGEVITPATPYTARTYDNVTPAMMLAALKTNANSRFNQADRDRFYKLGVLIHEKFQIQRDRTYGFRPSPAANTWNYNPYFLDTFAPQGTTLPRTLWSSACDPTVFAPLVSPGAQPQATLLSPAEVGAPSLGLSRLCGTVTPSGIFHNATGDATFPARGGTSPNVPQPTQPEYQVGATPDPNFPDASPAPTGIPVTPATLATIQPEFPALYYIFPELRHGHLGDLNTTTTPNTDHRQPGNNALYTELPVAFQPWKEPYITSSVINDPTVNGSVQYEVVGSGSASNTLGDVTPFNIPSPSGDPAIDSFNYQAIDPLPAPDVLVSLGVTPRTQGSWTTPTATPGTNSPNRIVTPSGGNLAIAFQDKVLFNGREWQPSRVLDIDLDMLRNAATADDAWLPKSGIVYAFREDALREDAIARPQGTVQTPSGIRQTSVTPGNETDPPKAAGENATKPVDYTADPDRRVHGFRLRNGERLKRLTGVIDKENLRGLSFFSDDVVYIMGDFNKHQKADGSVLEEFREQLGGVYDPTSFYNRTTPDDDFATATVDEWRPSEILGDSVTILSNAFCDGSANDNFMAPRPNPNSDSTTQIDASIYNDPPNGLYGPGCTAADGRTSFLNQNRPNQDPTTGSAEWMREIPTDPQSPVKVSRNGNPLVKSTTNATAMPVEYAGRYNGGAVTVPGGFFYGSGPAANNDNLPGDRSVQFSPPETTVNTIMISGIVPSRNQQAYGGLHNFPRFLERWNGQNLRFSGSFIQLNFSNYSTAPYDQDVWEPGVDANANEVIDYYQPPNRLWGYDVALQFVTPGPAAKRFAQLSKDRNEFYTEPPANDFYMQNLCRSLRQNAASAPNGIDLSGLRCPT